MTSQPTAPPKMSEESRIRDLLGRQSLVDDWIVETGDDYFGDPGIWVWVILKSSQKFEQREKIEQQVLETIAKSGEKRWVYVQFRTKEEQEELEREEQEEFEEGSE